LCPKLGGWGIGSKIEEFGNLLAQLLLNNGLYLLIAKGRHLVL